jgi:hypothetical protein
MAAKLLGCTYAPTLRLFFASDGVHPGTLSSYVSLWNGCPFLLAVVFLRENQSCTQVAGAPVAAAQAFRDSRVGTRGLSSQIFLSASRCG